jgi:sialidase-1
MRDKPNALVMNRILVLLLLSFHSFTALAQSSFFEERPLFVNGVGGYECYRIPAIVAAKDGTLLAFVEGRVNGCSDYGDVDLLLSRSKDRGKTWSEPNLIVDNEGIQAGNPAPVYDFEDPKYPNGRLFLFYNTGDASEHEVRKGNGQRGVHFISSTDDGLSWSPPTDITSQVHFNRQNSKLDWRTNAVTPGHALQLSIGVNKGRIYVPANHSQGPPQEKYNEYRAYGFYSDDHGQSFKTSPDIPVLSSNEAIGVELENGDLMLNIREQNGDTKTRLVSISNDGGESWNEIFFDQNLISPVCQSSIISIVNDNKQLLLYSGPYSKTDRHQMSVLISEDQGKSWPVRKLIYADTSAYSDLVILDDNSIGLFYERDRNGLYFARFNLPWLYEN